MLSCYIPYNFPKADAEKIEELRVFMIQIKPQREYWLDQLSKCLSGRICNQILQILAGPVASSGKSTLFNLISQAFGTDYYCNMPATYLTQKSPQANISRSSSIIFTGAAFKIGINIPTPRLLWNRGFWGWANNPRWTHANLSIPCLLASPKNLQQQWGGLQSSLKESNMVQPRIVWQWGFWGWANNPSWTHANLAPHLTSCKVHKVHKKKPFGQPSIPRKKQEARLHVCKCTPTPKERLKRQLVDINKSQWGTNCCFLYVKTMSRC